MAATVHSDYVAVHRPLHQDPTDTSELSARQDIFATAVGFDEAKTLLWADVPCVMHVNPSMMEFAARGMCFEAPLTLPNMPRLSIYSLG